MSVTDGPAEPDPLARLIEAAVAGDGSAWGMLYDAVHTTDLPDLPAVPVDRR